MIKGAIFDIDGTLLDSMPVWENAGARYLATLGIEARSDLKERLDALSLPEAALYMQTEYKLSVTTEEILEGVNQVVKDFYFKEAVLKPGVCDLIQKLKPEVKQTVRTQRSRELFRMEDISFSYQKHVPVLEHLNLSFDQRTTAIIGQNGAGKTTLVRLLKGLLKPVSGTVYFGGEDISKKTVAMLAGKVGYVFQNPDDQIFHATVESEVRYGPKTMKLDPAEEDRRVQEALKITGMEEFKDENPMNLPLSMRKFVTIAAVIAMGTEILIFDEPTAGQDVEGNKKLSEILKVLHGQGKTVITISHDMEFVASNFDKVIVMAKKKVVRAGTPKEIF